ncbi:MAG: amylo-alpha-1,6-glucosidase [Terriglobia bacterium]
MPGESSAKEIIRVKDRFYILASSSLADSRTQVLKQDESFAVFDRHGDIDLVGSTAQGLFHEGTRFLSHLVLMLNGERPILLSSAVKEDNLLLTVDLENPDILSDGNIVLARGALHISREKLLWGGVCYERFAVANYGLSDVSVSASIQFQADFADVFEVRGTKRDRRGRSLEPKVGRYEVVLEYEGLDKVIRRSRIRCSPKPARLQHSEMRFEINLPPGGRQSFLLTVACETEPGGAPHVQPIESAFQQADDALRTTREMLPKIHTSNEQFNDWINRAGADLRMLTSMTPEGPYPYAGVPWFSAPFGRDGIITALEMLWIEPVLAHSVLAYLAATQATETIPESDAEPGKILHEARGGEMAALKEVPFGRYYGSVDATPLFIMLAGAYFERTGDRELIERIWPNIELAAAWIEKYGDTDGDGFVEYARHSANGLEQQGWKDSRDSIYHADGRLAEPPIALCEVQGYVFSAFHRAAVLAEALGDAQKASALRAKAQRLRAKFEEAFWCDDISCYALALDGAKKPCQVRASNAGHCLFAGIASDEHARRTTETLLRDDVFSGWGIRTVSSTSPRFNPMSYHNGSVWPHDNALIASGMARYGLAESAVRVFTGIFDAAIFVDLHRLPELFCGFRRRPGEGPILYPVACSPQAWSAASVFMLLGACLGISVTAKPAQIRFTHAFLPESVPEVKIERLAVGEASVDLSILRFKDHVSVNILRREGDVEIIAVK